MHFLSRIALMIAAGMAISVSPVVAQGVVHHRHHGRYAAAQPDGSGEPFGYRHAPYPRFYGGESYGGNWEAATNARLTAQAYRDPGVTLELAPDAKETATGGPAGGVPGFGGR